MPYFRVNETLDQRRRAPALQVRNYHSRVKAGLFARGAEGTRRPALLDLAAGRGADCARYRSFARVTAVDKDSDALVELLRRASRSLPTCCVQCLQVDMTDTVALGETFDVVSVMSALHYACEGRGRLERFAENVARHVRPGGAFIGLDLDGAAVRAALGSEGRRSFTDWATLQLDGDSLWVTIRSISDRAMREGLLDWAAFEHLMASHGFVTECTHLLSPDAEVVDEDLRSFSRLHRCWVMRKAPTAAGPAPPAPGPRSPAPAAARCSRPPAPAPASDPGPPPPPR